MKDRIEDLLGRMSIEEKVSMLAGSDQWHGTGVPRLGIPPIKMTDGPCGARGGQYESGTTAACFPCGTALAATWNPELVERVGAALAEEARTKRAQVLLAPTVNIHRSPLAGRNFECYSEDPHLTARIAVSYIRGVQSRGVQRLHQALRLQRLRVRAKLDQLAGGGAGAPRDLPRALRGGRRGGEALVGDGCLQPGERHLRLRASRL
jgi:hypothetical protein